MKKSFAQLVLCMIAFIAVCLYGIFYGPKYPMIFLGVSLVYMIFVFMFIIKPRPKDSLLLLGGIIVGCIVYEISARVANYMAPNTEFLRLIIKIIMNAPMFILIWNYLLPRTLRNSKFAMEIAEKKKKAKK